MASFVYFICLISLFSEHYQETAPAVCCPLVIIFVPFLGEALRCSSSNSVWSLGFRSNGQQSSSATGACSRVQAIQCFRDSERFRRNDAQCDWSASRSV